MHRAGRLIAVAVGIVVVAAMAFAHAHPKTMSPAPDSTVSDPHRVSIEFSEALEGKFSSIKLADASGAAVSKAASQLDPADAKHMTLDVPHLEPGVYTVKWVTVATDGHRLAGEYKFTVK